MQISSHLDLYITKFDQLLSLGDFNAGVKNSSIKNFCSIYKLTSVINRTTCFKNPENNLLE